MMNSTLYITCGTLSTCAEPQKIRLGPCMCLDDVYEKNLSFYIWTLTKLLYKQGSMFWIFGGFDILKIIFCHEFHMLYHIWLCSVHPCDITLLFFFSITNNPIRKNIFQVIKYNWIETIKSEPTFGNSSIRNQSSLSNKKEDLTGYQL